jgi:FkbM family methyltransferase
MVSPTLLPQPILRTLIRLWARGHGARVRFADGVVRIERDSRVMILRASHLFYVPAMIERFDTYHGAIEAPNGVADFSAPRRHTYRPSGTAWWTPAMPEEPGAIAGYFRLAQPTEGDIVFDLGAHAGFSTYQFSRMVGPSGHVVALEPDPVAFECLTKNLADYGIGNVTPIQAAVAGTRGRRDFNVDSSLGATFADIVDRHGKAETREVECRSLGDLCDEHGVPSFIKMDIEGAELEVLAASIPLLRANSLSFTVDTHHRLGGRLGGTLSGDYTTRRVERIFREAGYYCESAMVDGFWTTWARPGGS